MSVESRYWAGFTGCVAKVWQPEAPQPAYIEKLVAGIYFLTAVLFYTVCFVAVADTSIQNKYYKAN